MFWHRNLNIVASSVKCILQFGPIDQKHCFVKATNKIENVELVKCGTVLKSLNASIVPNSK